MDATSYAYPSTTRPWLRSNFVATIDGRTQDPSGVSGSLGGEPDHRVFTILRSLADVVLVGAGTARVEGYGPIRPDDLDATVAQARVPRLALVSGRLDVPDALRVPGVLVVTTTSADQQRVEDLRAAGVEVLRHGDDAVDWPAVLADLADRGLGRILCEGGPGLHGTLLEQDLVDELCLTVAPVLTTGTGLGITASDQPLQRDFELGHAVAEDGVLLTRWVRRR